MRDTEVKGEAGFDEIASNHLTTKSFHLSLRTTMVTIPFYLFTTMRKFLKAILMRPHLFQAKKC